MFVIGCDTGIELNGAGLSVVANANVEANVGVLSRGNTEGTRLQNVSVESFADSFAGSDGQLRHPGNCPVTLIAEAAGERHRATIAYAVSFSGCRS